MADLALIKKLRGATGCGISDCNKAIKDCGDSYEECVDWLRKKGLSKAAKKSGRVTAEGLVAVASAGNKAAMVEVNSETDFVARNDQFQNLAKGIAEAALTVDGDLEKLMKATFATSNLSVEEELKARIGVIGENLNVRRSASLSVSDGVVAAYLHNAVAAGMGKIGVLVALESTADKNKLEELGKMIAMHIAATKPDCLDIESVDADKLAREKEVLMEQARASGKPENIIEKMIIGRIRKYYEEICLVEQTFVMDTDKKIKDVIKASEKELGTSVKLAGFKLFVLGEGIEKEENDFAAEVASMAK